MRRSEGWPVSKVMSKTKQLDYLGENKGDSGEIRAGVSYDFCGCTDGSPSAA